MAAEQACSDPAYSQYGPDEGMPELRAALHTKIEEQNGLHGVSTLCMLVLRAAISPMSSQYHASDHLLSAHLTRTLSM